MNGPATRGDPDRFRWRPRRHVDRDRHRRRADLMADNSDGTGGGDADEWVGRWPRCEECGQLLRRDSGNCKNPVCPGKAQDGDQR